MAEHLLWVVLQVTTHTSDIEGAGTSARVAMVLTGAAGSSSSSLSLDHPSSISGKAPAAGLISGCGSNGFGRGEAACFDFSCAQLGELQQLEVWHDSSGPQPAWHLAYVEVTELRSGKVWSCPSMGLIVLKAAHFHCAAFSCGTYAAVGAARLSPHANMWVITSLAWQCQQCNVQDGPVCEPIAAPNHHAPLC